MGKLEVDFKFHNVGQGLFYTGRLKYERTVFNFVYDCGSEKTSLVKDAIDREFQPDEEIDLLIVSHLHRDHTSGIPHLFKRASVDTVILPYLSPLERLIVALTTPRASREYYHFLADPVTYFLEHNVRRVVLVGGKEADRRENWMPPFERPPDFPLEGGFELIDELPPDEELSFYIKSVEPELSRSIGKGNVEVKNHSGILKVSLNTIPIWVFRLFTYKLTPLWVLVAFKQCVEQKLGAVDSGTLKDAIRTMYYKENKNKYKLLVDCYIDEILRNSHLIPMCYHKKPKYWSRKSLVKYLNDLSLIILHMPAFRCSSSKITCVSPCCGLCCHYNYCVWWDLDSQELSQFLTGDINLNCRFNEISQHFGLGSRINHTITTLVPHHGSRYNWTNVLCNTITSNFWIVSAGIHNRYGHPSSQVLGDICVNCHYPHVVWVNEATYFRLMGILEF
ncbi:MBL fold metallo-hydrolase [Thermococcus aciditolerans]|nr:MBL fold metallo-hydrolase [Thermococcus aciditolerans]